MKTTDLRSKSTIELQDELNEKKNELFKLRFQHATNSLENPLQLKQVRRDIARIKTIMREQELQAEKTNGGAKA